MQTIEQWGEWKEKCALGLCGEETRRALQAFAHARFQHFAAAYARTTNVGDPSVLTPGAGEAWHWFETHFLLGRAPGGKNFKQWLFAELEAKGYSSQEGVEAGASLLMRDVVRERLRREYSGRHILSLDRAAEDESQGEPAPNLQELLPAPLDTMSDVERRELEELALKDSVSAFDQLNRRECLALLAHELGLSLAHPAVLRAAECGKSVLNTAFSNARIGVAAHVRARHPREDASTMASLTCLVWANVREMILSWGKSENDCAQLCILVER
jgi:hypothetical protein